MCVCVCVGGCVESPYVVRQNYLGTACVCVCVCVWVWVWVWARAGELHGIPVREPLRASVSSFNGASGGIVIV
jgi:hypothetical protein